MVSIISPFVEISLTDLSGRRGGGRGACTSFPAPAGLLIFYDVSNKETREFLRKSDLMGTIELKCATFLFGLI